MRPRRAAVGRVSAAGVHTPAAAVSVDREVAAVGLVVRRSAGPLGLEARRQRVRVPARTHLHDAAVSEVLCERQFWARSVRLWPIPREQVVLHVEPSIRIIAVALAPEPVNGLTRHPVAQHGQRVHIVGDLRPTVPDRVVLPAPRSQTVAQVVWQAPEVGRLEQIVLRAVCQRGRECEQWVRAIVEVGRPFEKAAVATDCVVEVLLGQSLRGVEPLMCGGEGFPHDGKRGVPQGRDAHRIPIAHPEKPEALVHAHLELRGPQLEQTSTHRPPLLGRHPAIGPVVAQGQRHCGARGARKARIALFCDVETRAVIPMVTSKLLYEIPLLVEKTQLGEIILERLGLKPRKKPNWKPWEKLVKEMHRKKPKAKIAFVGKYVELHDAYMSVREATRHAALSLGLDDEILWIHSSDLEKGRGVELFQDADGIIVPGGFGERGIEGKIHAARYARENNIPYLGLCLGMQVMVIEFARHVLSDDEANSTEFDPSTPHPVIDLMPDQRDLTDMGGTMRLGLYPCQLQSGSLAADAYNADSIDERHRHRFEFKNMYREKLQEAGMEFSGLSPDERLVEIAEMKDHPFMLGTQFHPEFLSRPTRPHPLFVSFLKAVKKNLNPK